MITFDRFLLSNGLRVVVHEDSSTPMAVVNIMYDVGARDENPEQTGFAHLFEHLMFGGSVNIPEYDDVAQMAGGENNAYTSNDLTNYYIQLPAENLEAAFWLESDRMFSLAFSKKSLDVQRKVVCEEFREHYLNKPYGDVGQKVRALSYTRHPYRWMTIGRELAHIENAQLEDVKNFFFKHYRPLNAILVVAGNVKTENVRNLAEKWFGGIPSGEKYIRQLPQEPVQTSARHLDVSAKVPVSALYKNYHMGGRLDKEYYVADLITELLANSQSSRLYQTLVKDKKLFGDIKCYHYGSIDPGMVSISGKLTRGAKIEEADRAVEEVLEELMQEGISTTELEKVKNKTEAAIAFEDMSVLNRANSLAFYELLGDGQLMNTELGRFLSVSAEDILESSRKIFNPNNCSTVYYNAETSN